VGHLQFTLLSFYFSVVMVLRVDNNFSRRIWWEIVGEVGHRKLIKCAGFTKRTQSLNSRVQLIGTLRPSQALIWYEKPRRGRGPIVFCTGCTTRVRATERHLLGQGFRSESLYFDSEGRLHARLASPKDGRWVERKPDVYHSGDYLSFYKELTIWD
jgi:hypothetical protein